MLFIVWQGLAEAYFHPAGRAVTGIEAQSWMSQCRISGYYNGGEPSAPTVGAASGHSGKPQERHKSPVQFGDAGDNVVNIVRLFPSGVTHDKKSVDVLFGFAHRRMCRMH